MRQTVERHQKPTTERNYGTFDSRSSTIVLAKKGILKAVCYLFDHEVLLTGIIICSFNNNALEKCANGKAFYIVATVQFIATLI